jgi:hypothetical protein
VSHLVLARWTIAPLLCAAAGCTLFVDFNNQREEPSPEAQVVDIDRAMKNIDTIVGFGDRSPGFNAEVASKVGDLFLAAGVDEVDIEEFATPMFTALGSNASITAPAGIAGDLVHEVNQFSGAGDIDAEVFDMGNGRAVRPEAEGKIVLIDALQTASIRVQYDSAVASNAAGILFNSNVDGGLLRQRHI